VTSELTLRTATPADYDAIAAVVDDWWGRPVRRMLPRLFLDHFHAALGFTVSDPLPGYDGPGDVKVRFERPLT
jgi:hypothetical protein